MLKQIVTSLTTVVIRNVRKTESITGTKEKKNAVIDKSKLKCHEKLDARHMSVINLTKIQIYKIAQCSVSSNKYPSIIIFLDVRKKTFK